MGLFDSNKTTTTSQTTNNDQRQVNTTTTSNYDLSNRSTNVTNVTDGGAIAGVVTVVGQALDGASKQTLAAYNYADSIFSAANVSVNNASKRVADAYSAAATMSQDALVTARQAYQDATTKTASAYQVAQAATADAYADAKGTTNSQKQIILGVLAVAGVLALAAFQRKAG
ncbi:hypothetical protein [Massilia sp. DD77]|uniref:hypothetical protein n=1 Tax=Massilia sp. DD77 TaxID=3109349 RepID=UPI003000B08D